MKNKKIISVVGFLIVVSFVFIYINLGAGLISAQSNTVCCEQTKKGAFCQDVPAEACAEDSRQIPTSCESTSFCKAGTCYDSNEGVCLDNTPQIVCNDKGGIWSEESPPQCDLGCCILGDQAAFVTLVRCKRLSSFLGLETNYDKSIRSELECVAAVQAQDKGACVYEFEFETTCKFTTRAECDTSAESFNGTSVGGNFFKDKLCSAEELGTNCGPSRKTICLPGKDEVYFVDTCGNSANIYDTSKIDDKGYWTNVKTKDESCNAAARNGNAGSSSCGNCNYLAGSYCRDKKVVGKNPTYGDFICADLNCVDENKNKRLHGESWCANDDRRTDDGTNRVGSRFFRQICINGEVVVEACADFRNEECIEDAIETSSGRFSQAACRVNRWQDCLAQTEKQDCENTDRRDCFWKEGVTLADENIGATCLPKNAPGLNFWNSEETKTICNQANKVCVVKFKKGLFEGEECVENCECLTEEWESKQGLVCSALGDCGPSVNWIGKKGFKEGFDVIRS
ncbi:MAG: hypothetical protein IIA87_02060 [Nanoarchaeota archaeon]|nr:hypothetical protein [Nanoarchaeota archaeon]